MATPILAQCSKKLSINAQHGMQPHRCGDQALLINAVEGPYSQPYFMKIICADRTKSKKQSKKRASETPSDKLKEEAAEAVGKVTAKGAKV